MKFSPVPGLTPSSKASAIPTSYREEGRPGIPPRDYFRMLFIGYFEGIDATTLEANAAMKSIRAA